MVNWPEELVGWGASDDRFIEAKQYLSGFRRLRIVLVWHNSEPHSMRKTVHALYRELHLLANEIICLNKQNFHALRAKYGRREEKIISYVPHPLYYSSQPQAMANGILVYGAIRTRYELCRLLFLQLS